MQNNAVFEKNMREIVKTSKNVQKNAAMENRYGKCLNIKFEEKLLCGNRYHQNSHCGAHHGQKQNASVVFEKVSYCVSETVLILFHLSQAPKL